MVKIEIQQTDNVLEVINKIKSSIDQNIELNIPEESVIFENILNLKLIQQQTEKMGKSVDFITDDELGNVLIESLSGKDIEYVPEQFSEEMEEKVEFKERFKLPSIKLPSSQFFDPIKAKKSIFLFFLIPLALVGAFIYYGMTAPRAKASITVGSQPFTRSITIKVKSEEATNVENMLLRGTSLSANVEESMEKETTGIKIIGKKATGKVKIYNRTTSDIELEKGDKLTYKGKSTDLHYFIKEDIEIPASEPEDPLIPESKMIPGEKTVEIEAENIGDAHNIEEGKTLEIADYDKDDLVAKSDEDISGGKSEEVKIVTEEDRTNLSKELASISLRKAEENIKNKLGGNQKLIEGSVETKIVTESFSADIDEEKEKISLTQSVSAKALVYTENDLNSFIDNYFKNVIPANHYMPEKDREIKVEVLGKSTNSVLTSEEADIQVTLRSIVIPDIKEDQVREDLKGKTNEEARSVIEGLKNVEYYEFSIAPVVPFFSKVPKDVDKIEVKIIKEDTGESL